MSENVVELTDLSRQFGEMFALDGVSLQVRRGYVHGLVGANGSGKTTMIKHILGLLKAESGSVRVFGLDPVRNPVAVLRRIGYLSEEREMPEWMRVDELMRYTQAFHPNWPQAYATVALYLKIVPEGVTIPLPALALGIGALTIPLSSVAFAPLALASHRHR